MFFAVVLGGGAAIGSLFYSDKIALSTAQARVVTPQQAPELHGIVDRVCALADMPKPRIAISPTDLPNAFATGRNSEHAVLCVTDGLMRRLNPEELEGVIAHELSHVAHKDVMVMTIASFLGHHRRPADQVLVLRGALRRRRAPQQQRPELAA